MQIKIVLPFLYASTNFAFDAIKLLVQRPECLKITFLDNGEGLTIQRVMIGAELNDARVFVL